MMPEIKREDMPDIEAIYVQPYSDDVQGCVIIEVVGGRKAYARFWPRSGSLEWGWTLHPTAQKVWSVKG